MRVRVWIPIHGKVLQNYFPMAINPFNPKFGGDETKQVISDNQCVIKESRTLRDKIGAEDTLYSCKYLIIR